MAYVAEFVAAVALLPWHVFTLMNVAAAPSPTLWYLTRALGVSAYVTLTLSVLIGTLRAVARKASERISWIVDELHQVIATLSGVLVAGHLLVLYFDPFLPFSLVNLLLPIGEPYRPLAVTLGVFAMYGMVALQLTSWFRRRLRYSWWRAIHYLSFITFGLVTLHGWLAGSDAGEPWMRAIYGGAASAVAFLVLVRFFVGPTGSSQNASSRALSEADM